MRNQGRGKYASLVCCVVIVLALLVAELDALKCRRCSRAKSNTLCSSTCDGPHYDACMTVFHYDGKLNKHEITKVCSKTAACKNWRTALDAAGWRCRMNANKWACVYCCGETECNRLGIEDYKPEQEMGALMDAERAADEQRNRTRLAEASRQAFLNLTTTIKP